MTLPPGQREVRGFPRFGTHGDHPAPAIPAEPGLEVAGPVVAAFTTSLGELTDLPRTEVVADLHCVAGWSATGLRWEGVRFRDFFRERIEPALLAGRSVTHVAFVGRDGYRPRAGLEDLLADDVLLAERLDGTPLTSDHGAPLRLVSPQQYGYVSTKHLCRIEVWDHEPPAVFHPDRRTQLALLAVRAHPRARVWHEERHRYLPGGLARRIYRRVVTLPT